MAEKKTRVHNLAKELSVDSKVIIEKCRAEGIELKNHMHVLSAGLEATIRTWFSEGSHATTLEESKPVELEKVRVKPRKRKTTAQFQPPASETESNVAVMEPPPVEPLAKPSKVQPSVPVLEQPIAPEPTDEGATAPPAAPPPEEIRPAAAAPSVEPPDVAQPPSAPVAAPPSPAVRVAGPQNIPRPAQLSGPKVVRIERPDDVSRTRPSPRPGVRPVRGSGPLPKEPVLPAGPDRGRDIERGRAIGRGGVKEGPEHVAPKKIARDDQNEVNEKLREWRDRDLIERRDRLAHASGRGIGGLRAIEGKQGARRTPGQRSAPVVVKKGTVELTEPIVLREYSRETGIPVALVVKHLMQSRGEFATINSVLDLETAQFLAAENGVEIQIAKARTGLDRLAEEFAARPRESLQPRPPVVTVLGHVDHGKTSLLDRIRKANVAEGEAGGITQHIGAYRVQVGSRWVTFLDTPGHTAFTAMRARGANLTDVVVLVVAADDGVMPTTIEAINHAKAANSTIVVALNKIDLPHDINKIYGQLAEHGLTPSGDWGGEVDVVKTSALTGEGIDELLSHLATLSEVLDLKADATLDATGTVIEAQRDEGLGNIARVLVQEGTLRPGDVMVCGTAFGKVRGLRDERGRAIKSAPPSTPVEVIGLSDLPQAGDRFYVLDDLQRAKEIAEELTARRREAELIRTSKPTNLESMLAQSTEGDVPELRIILRGDTQGSIDVLQKTLSEQPADQVRLNILHSGVGAVTESDVVLAQASQAIIVAFHVTAEPGVQKLAEGIGVEIREYRVIYNLLDEIKQALEGLLEPDEKIESRGRAEVREVFNITRVGRVAGCSVKDGVIVRNHLVRLLRDGVVLKEGVRIDSLRRFKDDVKEVKSGFECGIRLAGFDDLKPADVLEAYEVVKVARKLGG